jgi:hypothetical protein
MFRFIRTIISLKKHKSTCHMKLRFLDFRDKVPDCRSDERKNVAHGCMAQSFVSDGTFPLYFTYSIYFDSFGPNKIPVSVQTILKITLNFEWDKQHTVQTIIVFCFQWKSSCASPRGRMVLRGTWLGSWTTPWPTVTKIATAVSCMSEAKDRGERDAPRMTWRSRGTPLATVCSLPRRGPGQ